MFETIGNFNFKIVDIIITGAPTLCINRHCITFSRKVLSDMEYPEYVQPLIDMENKAFAIKLCNSTDERAMGFFSRHHKPQGGIVLSSEPLRKLLKTLMSENWKPDKRYKIFGTYIPDVKAMVFDLKTAKEEEILWSHLSNKKFKIKGASELA